MVKVSDVMVAGLGSVPAFSRLCNTTSDLKMGTLVATLPDALRNKVSAGTGWPGVSVL